MDGNLEQDGSWRFKKVQKCPRRFKMVQDGSRKFKKAQEKNIRCENDQIFKKVQEGIRRFKKVAECSWISIEKWFQKL